LPLFVPLVLAAQRRKNPTLTSRKTSAEEIPMPPKDAKKAKTKKKKTKKR
jgi:hypothetical protein